MIRDPRRGAKRYGRKPVQRYAPGQRDTSRQKQAEAAAWFQHLRQMAVDRGAMTRETR